MRTGADVVLFGEYRDSYSGGWFVAWRADKVVIFVQDFPKPWILAEYDFQRGIAFKANPKDDTELKQLVSSSIVERYGLHPDDLNPSEGDALTWLVERWKPNVEAYESR